MQLPLTMLGMSSSRCEYLSLMSAGRMIFFAMSVSLCGVYVAVFFATNANLAKQIKLSNYGEKIMLYFSLLTLLKKYFSNIMPIKHQTLSDFY